MSRLESAELVRMAIESGFDCAGICDAVAPPHHDAYRSWIVSGMHGSMEYLERHSALKEHPDRLLPGAKSLLIVALNYNQTPERSDGEPKIARYALGRDYHRVVRRMLRAIGNQLTELEPGTGWLVCVDSAPLMERDFAQLAGIGWFGKNTMLINSQTGSWFVLGALILDRRFEPSSPAVGSCGSCQACVDACPTGAIVHVDDRWQVDARRCVSYLTIEHRGEIETELAQRVGGWTFGCDVCQEVCPFNAPRAKQPKRARETTVADFLAVREWPKLTHLASISFHDWDIATNGSPVRRAGYDGLKRNAEINLANSGRSNPESL